MVVVVVIDGVERCNSVFPEYTFGHVRHFPVPVHPSYWTSNKNVDSGARFYFELQMPNLNLHPGGGGGGGGANQ